MHTTARYSRLAASVSQRWGEDNPNWKTMMTTTLFKTGMHTMLGKAGQGRADKSSQVFPPFLATAAAYHGS